MTLKLMLLAATLTAYDSKCPGWDDCSVYTHDELAIIYYNSKYCMDLVPDKMVIDGFGYGQVRELCLGRGLDIVNFRGAPKEDETEEISNCVAKYFGISVVAPTYTCLQQALAKDISAMEKIPYSSEQKQVILGMVDKCIVQVDQKPRAACRAAAARQLNTGAVWKANLSREIQNCLHKDGVTGDVLTSTSSCLNAALAPPLAK